ncbi:MAG: hypothetical protein OEZ43_14780 [Gammaproteobacteria bacterium]|nr:hypothetical protein [Gammaproteobacteria bacterium]
MKQQKRSHLLAILISLVLMTIFCLPNNAYSSDTGSFGLRPVLGYSVGQDKVLISDYILINGETSQETSGSSYLDNGGGLLFGVDLTYTLDQHSRLGMGFRAKGNFENPELSYLDATFSTNMLHIMYIYQHRMGGIDVIAGIGATYHTGTKFSMKHEENSSADFAVNYLDTIAPMFDIALEKITREGVALYLGVRAHLVTYKGKDVLIEGIDTSGYTAKEIVGNSLDFSFGATWYF